MKKVLILMLVFVLVMASVVVPTQAGEADNEVMTNFTMKSNKGTTFKIEPASTTPVELYGFYSGKYNKEGVLSAANTISPDEKITIKNVAGEELSFQIHVTPYSNVGDMYASGHGEGENLAHTFMLMDDGTFGAIYGGYMDGFELGAGQTRSFVLNGEYYGANRELAEVADDAYFHVHIFMIRTESDFYDLEEYDYFFKMTGTGTLAPVGGEEEVPEEEVSANDIIKMAQSESYVSDYGFVYDFSVTNPGDEPMNGYYAVLSYAPKKVIAYSGEEYYMAELYPVDVNLAPGESEEVTVTAGFHLSSAVNLWVTFDSKAERDAFVRQDGINEGYSGYGDKYELSGEAGEKILKDTFDVTIKPAK